MATKRFRLGVDVGGSHISCALVDCNKGSLVENSKRSIPLNPGCSILAIEQTFKQIIQSCLEDAAPLVCEGIGIAMPGPFDYQRGISKINGVQKFEQLFGLNLRMMLQDTFQLPVVFTNDATCFALGEYFGGAAQNSTKTIVITLGTGFGSTFLIDGQAQTKAGVGIPEDGYLYSIPFGDSIADDYFSTRWFLKRWKELCNEELTGVKAIADLARQNQSTALELFREFAHNLSLVMEPWFESFHPDTFVLGGSIAKASDLFMPEFEKKIKSSNLQLKTAVLGEDAPLIGAAMVDQSFEEEDKNWRLTQQFLAPEKSSPTMTYDLYPAFPIGEGKIQAGIELLSDWIFEHPTVVIDGYVGVFWDQLVKQLQTLGSKKGKKIRFFHSDAAMKPAKELDEMLAPYLNGDDPVFGKVTDKQLVDWFDLDLLKSIQPDPNAEINILLGCGASLAEWEAPLVYIDLPKNELQFRMRARKANNLGVENFKNNKQTYKRFFFVDWKVLNDHKCALLPHMDLVVDEQRPQQLLFMTGEELREGLRSMSENFFRVRPWFEPGAWGGSWMKDHIKSLNQEVDNLAWSFELMVLENGIMFESNSYRFEVSFDFLMFNNYQAVLGDCADRFKYDFPIRFDFLDTINGGNLSVQCHPRNEYIKEHFNMPFTQDETYYILDCVEPAEVYLGFQAGVDPEEFNQALCESQEQGKAIDICKYVQKHPAKKHDLFLIPNGTVHASGSGNMVLEISSAPYIFTFKMYDWMRLDLDGTPRPINIEQGMKNLYFDRQGEKVEKELICHPYIQEETEQYTIEHLPTHANHFYDVYRYHFKDSIQIQTNNKCHVWMLVEGEAVEIETAHGMKQRFNYAETFVIPAAAKSYTITNKGKQKAMMVQSFVK